MESSGERGQARERSADLRDLAHEQQWASLLAALALQANACMMEGRPQAGAEEVRSSFEASCGVWLPHATSGWQPLRAGKKCYSGLLCLSVVMLVIPGNWVGGWVGALAVCRSPS